MIPFPNLSYGLTTPPLTREEAHALRRSAKDHVQMVDGDIALHWVVLPDGRWCLVEEIRLDQLGVGG